MKARLLLEDGTCFTGTSFGAEGEKVGEVVFNTSMTGYQEVLTDPSYCGQIITMTYPLIGNYGLNREDVESKSSYVFGFVVREYAEYASNWRNELTIDQWLKKHGIPGIAGIDTRMLTRKIRLHGTMKGIITTKNDPIHVLQERLQTPLMQDQVAKVSESQSGHFVKDQKRVVLVDLGVKHQILRELEARNCEIVTVPYNAKSEEVLQLQPDGVVFSNGPGDPKSIPESIELCRDLLGKVPIFGICMGHLLFALACGADTEKMKFGHRGGNHPVKELATERTVMTSQNHGYAVKASSIDSSILQISHLALNDGTVEGLEHRTLPAFSVQFHPEASPGPRDSRYLFDRFIEMIDTCSTKEEKTHA